MEEEYEVEERNKIAGNTRNTSPEIYCLPFIGSFGCTNIIHL